MPAGVVLLVLLVCQFSSGIISYCITFIMYFTIGIFTIVPVTQYVYLNDTVTFECATNLTGYTISFLFGTDPMDTITDLSNGGKRTTFTATSEINGTNIICLARMGIMIFNTDAAYLYAQGMPIVRIILGV